MSVTEDHARKTENALRPDDVLASENVTAFAVHLYRAFFTKETVICLHGLPVRGYRAEQSA